MRRSVLIDKKKVYCTQKIKLKRKEVSGKKHLPCILSSADCLAQNQTIVWRVKRKLIRFESHANKSQSIVERNGTGYFVSTLNPTPFIVVALVTH